MAIPAPEQLAPKIGRWAAFCCEEDLFEIKTQEQVDEIATHLPGGENDDLGDFQIFESSEDAMRILGAQR